MVPIWARESQLHLLVRAAVGPALVGLGAWAAAGSLAPGSLETPLIRLAAPAPIAWAVSAFVLALLVPAFRRHPMLATPATLAALPWLPLPLPSMAFLWTGRLAWVPVGLALLGAVLASLSRQFGPIDARTVASPGRSMWVAGMLTMALAALAAWSLNPRLPTGDEPHYLVIAQSLLEDGDLRIENNHSSRDYADYYGDISPQFIRRGRNDTIYSIHAPGVPILVAPLFALFGYRGAQITILLVAACAGALTWLGGWLATGNRPAAWFAWAAVTGSTTFLVHSVTIFPDGPGAAGVAAVVVLALALARRDAVSRLRLVTASSLLSALPFLHTRFVVLSVGLGLVVAGGLLAADGPERPLRRVRRLATFLVVPAIGTALWFAYFWTLYGTLNPAAPYGTDTQSRLWYAPGGFMGLLFDQQFGLVTFSPVMALALVTWTSRRRSIGEFSPRGLALVVLAYLAAVASYWMWWGGEAPPARLAASVLPALSVPLAIGWARAGQMARTFWVTLLAVSLAITGLTVFVDRGLLAWNSRDAHAAWLDWFGAVVDLPRVWPSFFWRLDPSHLQSEWWFVSHVLAWCASFALAGVALAVSRRAGALSPSSAATRAAWWLPVGVMLAGTLGVWMDGGGALRPATAQVAVLQRAADGARLFEIAPGRIRTVDAAVPPFRVTVPRVDLPGSPAAEWATLTGVPAGRYEIRIQSRRPVGGVLTVRVNRAESPPRAFALARLSNQTVTVTVPEDAMLLRFDADETLAASADSIELVPWGM